MSRTWVVFGILTLTTGRAVAQVPSVHVDSIRGQLKVVFPAVPLTHTGCRYATAETGRAYSWTASAAFPDSRYPRNHIFELRFHFFFPDTIELTEARFDSIAAVIPIWVAELRGEPPIGREPYRLDHYSVQRDSSRLTLLIQGRQAVDGLLQTGTRHVVISWCKGSQRLLMVRAVPLERTSP